MEPSDIAGPVRDGLTVLWTPLGADGPAVVRASGRALEALVAARERRRPLVLHHAALEVRLSGTVRVVEMTPVWGQPAGDRGVLAEGAVGARVLGRSRYFRYEVRCRPVDPATATGTGTGTGTDERTPGQDAGHPSRPGRTLRHDLPATAATATAQVRAVLSASAEVPLPVWGRRVAGTTGMWCSNSVVAYLLARAGADLDAALPPPGGRAPGWSAGLTVAARSAPDRPAVAGAGIRATRPTGPTAAPARHR